MDCFVFGMQYLTWENRATIQNPPYGLLIKGSPIDFNPPTSFVWVLPIFGFGFDPLSRTDQS
jgi:hypothetical protein